MADDISKKVLIQVDIANQDAQTKMGALEGAVNDLATATTALKTVTKNTQDAFTGYNEKLNQSKLNAQQNREEITRLNLVRKQEAESVRVAKGAIEAASGSYKEAQQSLTKLGNAIKSTKDGFTSTSPVIKAQIKDYNDLNAKLKAFDAQMGNYQRNVGGYTEALSGINGILGRLVPGFSQFSSILQSATKGFSAMGNETKAASTGVAASGEAADGTSAAMMGLGGVGIALAGVFAIVGAAAVGTIAYFKDVATWSDFVSNSLAGAKAGWTAFFQNAGTGHAIESMHKAAEEARSLDEAMLNLNRDMLVSEVQSNKENQFIATQMLKMRNLHTTSKEAENIFNEVQKTADEQYKRVSRHAESGYNIVANKIKVTAELTRDELREIARDGVAAAEQFKKEGKHISDDLIADLAKFQAMRDSAQGIKDQVGQRAQNREDQKIAKNEKAAAAALAKEQQEANELAKIKSETEQANSERIASIVRTLDFQRQSFAKELSDADEHYRQLIFKQKEFISKMQVIVDSKKSTPKEKRAALGAIGAANTDISQLGKEHTADQQKLLEVHYKAMLATTQKAANDLAQLQIQSIDDAQDRDTQAERLSYKEKNEALNKELTDLTENKAKLNSEIKTATNERAAILKKELSETQTLIDTAHDKRVESELQHQQKLLDITKKFEDEKLAITDETNLLNAETKNSSGTNEKGVLAAEKKQILDQYNIEVSAKGVTDAKKLELEAKYLKDSDTLNKAYLQKKKDYELQIAQQVENAAFTIIEKSMQQANQAFEVNLNRQKDHDLQNQSLTETQKYQVSEKYRVLAGKQKVKEFNQEKELALVKGAIDTAAAVLKASPDVPLMILAGVTGALELGVIASQKAPAYAQGGLHYNSDGRGGVLPGYSKNDNTNAYLRSGEAVVVSEAMRDPWARNIVSAINQSYGGRSFDSTVPVNPWFSPGFASGGVFSNYLPTGDNGLRANMSNSGNGRMHPDDISGIAQAVANIKFPAPVMDIKDVNYQQSRLSSPYDRGNY